MATTSTVTFRVRIAWWFKPYTLALCFVAALTRAEPDWQKFERVIKRAVKLELI